MFVSTLTGLVIAAAHAATLEVALKDRVGTLYVPDQMDVAVSFAAGPTDKPVEATWTNTESNGVAIVCGDKGQPPADERVDAVTLQVGADKWALAPGSGVRFTCPAAKAVVVDVHGTTVGTFAGPVLMTVVKAKSRAEH